MIQAAITSKGQTTLPKAVREALRVQPGDRVCYVILENEVRMLPVRPLARLFGTFKHDGPAVTLSHIACHCRRGVWQIRGNSIVKWGVGLRFANPTTGV